MVEGANCNQTDGRTNGHERFFTLHLAVQSPRTRVRVVAGWGGWGTARHKQAEPGCAVPDRGSACAGNPPTISPRPCWGWRTIGPVTRISIPKHETSTTFVHVHACLLIGQPPLPCLGTQLELFKTSMEHHFISLAPSPSTRPTRVVAEQLAANKAMYMSSVFPCAPRRETCTTLGLCRPSICSPGPSHTGPSVASARLRCMETMATVYAQHARPVRLDCRSLRVASDADARPNLPSQTCYEAYLVFPVLADANENKWGIVLAPIIHSITSCLIP